MSRWAPVIWTAQSHNLQLGTQEPGASPRDDGLRPQHSMGLSSLDTNTAAWALVEHLCCVMNLTYTQASPMLSGYSDKLLVWWMTNLGSQGIHISLNKKLGFWRSSILLQVIKESVCCFHYYALTELKLLNWSHNLMLDSAFLKLAVITWPSSKEPTVRKVDAVVAMGRGQLLCKFCSLFLVSLLMVGMCTEKLRSSEPLQKQWRDVTCMLGVISLKHLIPLFSSSCLSSFRVLTSGLCVSGINRPFSSLKHCLKTNPSSLN